MAYPGEPLSSFVEESGGGGQLGVLNPTAIKRWIAIEMRRLREAAGIDVATAAKRIGKAKTVINHIETGRNLPAPADLEVLLNLFGVPERTPFFHELIKTAKRGTDWWHDFGGAVPEWFTLLLGLESAAARIRSYDAQLLPGLAQTRTYAEAVYQEGEHGLTDDQVAAAVDLRIARQNILNRDDPPQLLCVIDESALRRQVGGSKVMRDQLDYLSELNARPNVEIQILPFSAGAHAGAEGSFKILDYPPEFEGDPGTTYVDTLPQGIYYELPEQVNHYRRVFKRLQKQADTAEHTETLISKAKKDT